MPPYIELSGLIADDFLSKIDQKPPYTIAVTGGVAVGKTTFSQELQLLLQSWPSHPHVDLVSTDGYLYPNAVLEKCGLMGQKGFPETYDILRLLDFLKDLKNGKFPLQVPIYSHYYKDILPNKSQTIHQPDIIIIEGLPLLSFDFFDFSIYVDADTGLIKQWYLERFMGLLEKAKQDKRAYLYQFAHLTEADAGQVAESIWYEVNQTNLLRNILPYREKARLILRKGKGHEVEKILIR